MSPGSIRSSAASPAWTSSRNSARRSRSASCSRSRPTRSCSAAASSTPANCSSRAGRWRLSASPSGGSLYSGLIGVLRRHGVTAERAVIVGTGSPARTVLETVRRSPHLGYHVVGFVADDLDHHADETEVLGLPVLGTTECLPRISAQGAGGRSADRARRRLAGAARQSRRSLRRRSRQHHRLPGHLPTDHEQ